MPEPVTRVDLHPVVAVLACGVLTAVGAGLGFVAGPLLAWLDRTVGGAPAPVLIAARLPDVVTVGGLALAGLAAGVLLLAGWREELLLVEVHDDGVRVRQDKRTRWVRRADVAAVYLDRDDLVIAGTAAPFIEGGDVGGLGGRRLATAFRRHGYPCRDEPPHALRFRTFVDGRDDLGQPATDLLRARARARVDKQRTRVAELRRELGAAGVLVRDRRGEQEYVVDETSAPDVTT